MTFFDKTAGVVTLSGKFNYIKGHFTYWTLHSWNRLSSIANIVKLYTLGLTDKQIDRLNELENAAPEEYWHLINQCLQDEELTRGIRVGFNGRSGGYLVLYSDTGNGSAVHSDYWAYGSYKGWLKDYARGWDYRSAQSDLRTMIEEDFELVKTFDRLCDVVRDQLIYMADNGALEEETYTVERTVQHLVLA